MIVEYIVSLHPALLPVVQLLKHQAYVEWEIASPGSQLTPLKPGNQGEIWQNCLPPSKLKLPVPAEQLAAFKETHALHADEQTISLDAELNMLLTEMDSISSIGLANVCFCTVC